MTANSRPHTAKRKRLVALLMFAAIVTTVTLTNERPASAYTVPVVLTYPMLADGALPPHDASGTYTVRFDQTLIMNVQVGANLGAPGMSATLYRFSGNQCRYDGNPVGTSPVIGPYPFTMPYRPDPNNIDSRLGLTSFRVLFQGDGYFYGPAWGPCVNVNYPYITPIWTATVHNASHAVQADATTSGPIHRGTPIHLNVTMSPPVGAPPFGPARWSYLLANDSVCGRALDQFFLTWAKGVTSVESAVVNTAQQPLPVGHYTYTFIEEGTSWVPSTGRCVQFDIVA